MDLNLVRRPDPSPRHPYRRFPLLFISSPLITHRHTIDRSQVCPPAWHGCSGKVSVTLVAVPYGRTCNSRHPDHLSWFWTQVRQPLVRVCFRSRSLLRKVPDITSIRKSSWRSQTELVGS